MNVGRIFERAASRNPQTVGLVDADAGVRRTYGEWYADARRLGAALQREGRGRGDRIAAITRNRAELATLYWATQLAGMTFVPYNFRASAAELTHLLENADPDALFFSAATREAVERARDSTGVDTFVYVDDDAPTFATSYDEFVGAADPAAFDPEWADRDETSVVLHTGGTTGKPKGVPRSHENTYAATAAHSVQATWERGERVLGLMSLFHTIGLHTLSAAVFLGGTWVAQRSFDPARTLDLIESEELTGLYLVPTVFHDLVQFDGVADADLDSVDHLIYAGASMQTQDVYDVLDAFDPDVLVNHYGSTEIYTHTVWDNRDDKPGCAGTAGVNARIRVVVPREIEGADPEATVDAGDFGEIIVDTASPEAFDGYLSQSTASAVEDGWFFTGDLGYKDDDGDLFVAGRIDDMIISGGENVYPIEVEQILDAHDAVDAVAVVGRPSEKWNETITAFVTVEAPEAVDFEALARALDEHCRESDEVADFKRPRQYFFVPHLSKSNVGKILRRELRKSDLDIEVYEQVDLR